MAWRAAVLHVVAVACAAKASRLLSHHSHRCLVSVGVSGRHGLATMRQTLQSYVDGGLQSFGNQTFVFYQDSDTPFRDGTSKRSLVESFGFEFYGHPSNSKFQSIHDVVQHARCKYVIFLEEDWLLFSPDEAVVRDELTAALSLLEAGDVHVVRERSRLHSGEPNHAILTYEKNHFIEDTHLLHSVHWSDEPDRLYPGRIWRCSHNPLFWCAKSVNADFTLNPILFSVDWWRQVVQPAMPGGDFNPDSDFHSRWGEFDLTVAQGMGLFSHSRLDRDPD